MGFSDSQADPETITGLTPFENSHLLMMLVEGSLKHFLGNLASAFGYEPEFGDDSEQAVPVDFSDLLTHMSLVRIAKVYNEGGKQCLLNYEDEYNPLFLEDAYDFLKHSVELAPPVHVERGIANTLLGEYYRHLGQRDKSISQFEQALDVFEKVGTEECAEHVDRVRNLLTGLS